MIMLSYGIQAVLRDKWKLSCDMGDQKMGQCTSWHDWRIVAITISVNKGTVPLMKAWEWEKGSWIEMWSKEKSFLASRSVTYWCQNTSSLDLKGYTKGLPRGTVGSPLSKEGKFDYMKNLRLRSLLISLLFQRSECLRKKGKVKDCMGLKVFRPARLSELHLLVMMVTLVVSCKLVVNEQ